MAISSIGVGSGLPLQDLLENLRISENYSLDAIKSRQVKQESRISAYGKLQSALEKLQGFSKTLSGQALFGSLEPTVSGSGFTATSTNKAIEGKYNIQVLEVARAQTLVATGSTSKTVAIGDPSLGGQLQFTINGEVKTIGLEAGKTSLQDVVAAINSQSDLGVRATIINDGTDSPYRLLLSASETGTQASVTDFAVVGNDDLNTAIGMGALTEQAATNAKITLDGLDIISQSNTITDVLEGVTLNVSSKTDAPESLELARKDEATLKTIKEFVGAYNDLQKTIKSVTEFDVSAMTQSALTGDSIARNVQGKMSQLMMTRVGSDVVQTLADIGITTDFKTGQLELSEEKLAKALSENLSQVTDLFQSENGIAARIDSLSKPFLDPEFGAFSSAIKGANTALEGLSDQYDMTAARIDLKMEGYRKQFTALDTLMSQMNSMSSYLTQQLSRMNIDSGK